MPSGHLGSHWNTKEKIRRSWELWGKSLFLVVSSNCSHIFAYLFVCMPSTTRGWKLHNNFVHFACFTEGCHKLIRIDYINACSLIPRCWGSFSVCEAHGEQPFIVNIRSYYSVPPGGRGRRSTRTVIPSVAEDTHLEPTSNWVISSLFLTTYPIKRQKKKKLLKLLLSENLKGCAQDEVNNNLKYFIFNSIKLFGFY